MTYGDWYVALEKDVSATTPVAYFHSLTSSLPHDAFELGYEPRLDDFMRFLEGLPSKPSCVLNKAG